MNNCTLLIYSIILSTNFDIFNNFKHQLVLNVCYMSLLLIHEADYYKDAREKEI